MPSADFWNVVTMVGIGTSIFANVWAALTMRGPGWAGGYRTHHAYVASVSAIYFVAFGVLYWGDVDRAEWSEFLTPISALVFFTIWAIPGFMQVRASRVIKRLADE